MSDSQNCFYVVGGTLTSRAPCYIQRRADLDLYEGLREGSFCYVLTSRQMGKSSLMIRTAARLREEGTNVVLLDLAAVGQNLSAEQWYGGLLMRMGSQLGMVDELLRFWQEHPLLGPMQQWMQAIRELVLPRVTGRVVIFVDEIDAVRSLPFSTDEFFAGSREFYNRRTEDSELERLSFCLLGVASPSDLIRDTRTTPFNIGQRIELRDFTKAEAAPLAQGLRCEGELGAALLKRILYWTGGHPYLTQRLCQSAAEAYPLSQSPNPQLVDRLCEELFFARRASERDDNLLFVRERMLRSEVDVAGLLSLYARAHQGKRVVDDETNSLMSILRLSGITRVEEGRLRVRNRVYERVFDREWVKAHMPDAELRRQRAAYLRGLLRATAVAVVILAAIASLTMITFQQRNRAEQQRARAEQQEQSNRRLLYVAHMNLAQRHLERWNIQRLQELLDVHIPDAGQEDLRGFEWYYFWRICNSGLLTLRNAGPVGSEAPPPGSKISATRSGDSVFESWDVATGLTTLEGHSSQITFVNFSSNGKTLITGTKSGELMFWNVITGQELTAPNRYGELVDGKLSGSGIVIFSPDGNRLATPDIERTVKLWDAVTGQELSTISGGGAINFLMDDVAFSPDGKTITSGSDDGAVKLWDVATGQELAALKGPEGSHISTVFSPDGKRLATTYSNGARRQW